MWKVGGIKIESAAGRQKKNASGDGISWKREIFCKSLRTRKFSMGKFFGASTHGILAHSGFRNYFCFGWLNHYKIWRFWFGSCSISWNLVIWTFINNLIKTFFEQPICGVKEKTWSCLKTRWAFWSKCNWIIFLVLFFLCAFGSVSRPMSYILSFGDWDWQISEAEHARTLLGENEKCYTKAFTWHDDMLNSSYKLKKFFISIF